VSPQQKSLAAWLPFGRRESERLTERTLGTTPSRETTRRELRRYIWRQWIIDKLYLAGIVGY
jgi:predicted secreted protein